MAAVRTRPRFATIGDVLHFLGDIPPDRVCLDPPPGTATTRDLLLKHGRMQKLYELVDGILVEKAMGSPESFLAARLIQLLGVFLDRTDAGFLYAPDALIKLLPKVVRGPDVSFVSWRQRPDRTVPMEQISTLVPDLAVEILSPRNTSKEIRKKIGEYFKGGVRLVWVINPRTRTAETFTAVAEKQFLSEAETLDGGDILPGFRLKLALLFEKLAQSAPNRKKRKK